MRTPGGGTGKYSPLRQAHERLSTEQSMTNAREITDVQMERAGTDAAKRAPATVARTAPHPPRAADVQGAAASVVVGAPAPGETQTHFMWRSLMTARLTKEQAEKPTEAERIERIHRTEKSPAHQRGELSAAMARIEQTESDKSKEQNSRKERETDIEPER